MKKIILGLVLSLSISAVFACHIDPIGECDDNSYFITKIFNPNSIYHFIVNGDTVEIFTTGAIVTDSLFSLNVAAGTEVHMAYSYIGSNYIEYSSAISSTFTYAGCGALPVRISNFYVKKKTNSVIISFNEGDESDIKEYNILASRDAVSWDSIKTLPPGAKSYRIPISLGVSTLLLPFLVFFNRKKKWFGLLLFALIVFISCKKDTLVKSVPYKFFQIQTVHTSGDITLSEIKKI